MVLLFLAHWNGIALCRDAEPKAGGWPGSCNHDSLPPPPPTTGPYKAEDLLKAPECGPAETGGPSTWPWEGAALDTKVCPEPESTSSG